jgi:predicted aspartyl protease
MGLTHIEGTVTGPKGKQATLKFLVDSGATYTLLPEEVWRAIELEPMDSFKCILRMAPRWSGECPSAKSRCHRAGGILR